MDAATLENDLVDKTRTTKSVTRWFLGTYSGRIVIGLVLIVFVQITSFWLLIILPYQREQRIAEKIRGHGGAVGFKYFGPFWAYSLFRLKTPLLERISFASLDDRKVPPEVFRELGRLTNVERLDLTDTTINDDGVEHLTELKHLECLDVSGTLVTDSSLCRIKELKSIKSLHLIRSSISDAGLEHLKGMNRLEDLRLMRTRVTDAGLVHLKELMNLKYLDLLQTQTTAEGREMLRKVLPKCQIAPNP